MDGIEIKGLDKLEFELTNISKEGKKKVKKAMVDCATDLLVRAKDLVPYRHGVLEGSGHIDDTQELEVSVGFGGMASAYALIQHENEEFKHALGRQAKYLEKPFNEKKDKYRQYIENAIDDLL